MAIFHTFHLFLDKQGPTGIFAIMAVFAVIGAGMWVGSFKVKGLSLGSAGVLFMALIFGHFHHAWMVHLFPTALLLKAGTKDQGLVREAITNVGLLLFVYAVGLQAGPRFFQVFKKKGWQFIIIGCSATFAAALVTLLVTKVFQLTPALGPGLYAGALTNTPALAGAINTAKTVGMDEKVLSAGYGLAYPFGIFSVVIFVQLLPGLLRIPASKAAAKAREDEKRSVEQIETRTLRMTNVAMADTTISALRKQVDTMANISRLKRGAVVSAVKPTTMVKVDDVLFAVGTPAELDKLHTLGDLCDDCMETPDCDIASEELVVSRKEVFGKTLESIHAWQEFHVVITRVRREGTEFLPSPELVLEPGDILRAVGSSDAVESLGSTVGGEERRLDETSLLPFAGGIALGVIVGLIPIPLPGGLVTSLGLGGGPFIVALILGHLGRIGPISVYVPNAAKYLSRELGLVLFLAGAGWGAGEKFMDVLHTNGINPLFAGALITVTAVSIAFLLMHKMFKWNMLSTAGALSACMTNPPALAASNDLAESAAPAVAFASLYPVAILSKILFAQILVLVINANPGSFAKAAVPVKTPLATESAAPAAAKPPAAIESAAPAAAKAPAALESAAPAAAKAPAAPAMR